MENSNNNNSHKPNDFDRNFDSTVSNTESLTNNESNVPVDTKINQSNVVGKLELLEERAVVDKERLDVGKVSVSKQTRTKTVNVPIELAEEVLIIETEYYDADSKQFLNKEVDNQDIIRLIEPTLESKPSIKVNGKEILLEDGPIEVVISRQVGVIKKETYAVQDIVVEKSTHIHKDSFTIELQHEELDVVEEGFLDHNTKNVKR